jgi:hypothetical protein
MNGVRGHGRMGLERRHGPCQALGLESNYDPYGPNDPYGPTPMAPSFMCNPFLSGCHAKTRATASRRAFAV